MLNAFDIDLISCVQQMVKRSKETDILVNLILNEHNYSILFC